MDRCSPWPGAEAHSRVQNGMERGRVRPLRNADDEICVWGGLCSYEREWVAPHILHWRDLKDMLRRSSNNQNSKDLTPLHLLLGLTRRGYPALPQLRPLSSSSSLRHFLWVDGVSLFPGIPSSQVYREEEESALEKPVWMAEHMLGRSGGMHIFKVEVVHYIAF
jgi:hypothetical protein